MLLFGYYLYGNASNGIPWLEANDPFLRSSLQVLSDSGVISSPTNQYPLRWSLFGDDIINNDTSHDLSVTLAQREVRYSMNSAKLNRGQSSAKFVASNEEAPSTGFGQFSKDKWGHLPATNILILAMRFE
ncbi:hypothetical protein EIJ81_02840 [Aliivibrio salmonicida]|uniref:hypothetical protein n=1 Tax=Aliivibrio salmonicida TaxID=40269 RepID=UPI000F71B4A3|nr:hypothetical protein [Aliivibrio salmonicida]AZL83739.1 hypothetical protein EIJ81_02840 [Aliivibrio salmonicida]